MNNVFDVKSDKYLAYIQDPQHLIFKSLDAFSKIEQNFLQKLEDIQQHLQVIGAKLEEQKPFFTLTDQAKIKESNLNKYINQFNQLNILISRLDTTRFNAHNLDSIFDRQIEEICNEVLALQIETSIDDIEEIIKFFNFQAITANYLINRKDLQKRLLELEQAPLEIVEQSSASSVENPVVAIVEDCVIQPVVIEKPPLTQRVILEQIVSFHHDAQVFEKKLEVILESIEHFKFRLEEEKTFFTFKAEKVERITQGRLQAEQLKVLVEDLKQYVQSKYRLENLESLSEGAVLKFLRKAFHLNISEKIEAIEAQLNSMNELNSSIFKSSADVQEIIHLRQSCSWLNTYLMQYQQLCHNIIDYLKQPKQPLPKEEPVYSSSQSLMDSDMDRIERFVAHHYGDPQKIDAFGRQLHFNQRYYFAKSLEKTYAQKRLNCSIFVKYYLEEATWRHIPSIYHLINIALSGGFAQLELSVTWALVALQLLNTHEQRIINSQEDKDSLTRLVSLIKSRTQKHNFGLDLNDIPNEPDAFNFFVQRYVEKLKTLNRTLNANFAFDYQRAISHLKNLVSTFDRPINIPQKPSLKSKTLLLLDTLIDGLSEKRCFSFELDKKKEKLVSFRQSMEKKMICDAEVPFMLAKIEQICAIRRNPFGFFAPNSLNQFYTLVREHRLPYLL